MFRATKSFSLTPIIAQPCISLEQWMIGQQGCKVYRWPKNANKKPTFAISLEKFDKLHIHKKKGKKTSRDRILKKDEKKKAETKRQAKRTVCVTPAHNSPSLSGLPVASLTHSSSSLRCIRPHRYQNSRPHQHRFAS